MSVSIASLNLSCIDTLLVLPCVIDSSCDFAHAPIITKAIETEDLVFRHQVFPGESLTAFLARIYDGTNKYDMDCTIYAQPASLVLSNKWPTTGGDIYLYMCASIGSNKIPQMGYLSVHDKKAATLLATLSTPDRGEWC